MSGFGFLGPDDVSSPFNGFAFMIQSMLAGLNTVKVVQVKAVNAMGKGAVGFVDVQPLVKQIDGVGNAQDHGVVHKAPFFRYQAGGAAVVLDPVVGDIGIMVCSDRDITSVKENRGTANPGSFAMMALSDGIYLGGILNGPVTTYVWIEQGKVTVSTDGGTSGVVFTPGLVKITGDLQVTGEVIGKVGSRNIHLTTHTHTQGNDSHNDGEVPTDPPTQGS